MSGPDPVSGPGRTAPAPPWPQPATAGSAGTTNGAVAGAVASALADGAAEDVADALV